jgi:hypothetical protein
MNFDKFFAGYVLIDPYELKFFRFLKHGGPVNRFQFADVSNTLEHLEFQRQTALEESHFNFKPYKAEVKFTELDEATLTEAYERELRETALAKLTTEEKRVLGLNK